MTGWSAAKPFTREQARAANVDESEIRRLQRRGVWTALRRGVYVESSVLEAASSPRRHAMEIAGLQLVLDCPTAAAATSAAAIWGLEMLAPPPAELVLVTADGVVHGERRDDYVLRAAELPAHHLRERFGVRLTSAARTVVDLARAGTLAEGVVVADSALRRGQVSKGELEAMLHDCARWPGIGRAGQVLKLADPKAESVLESVSRVSMHEQHLPAPRTQVVLCSEHGEPCGRVDFFWEESGVIGEADGVGKYDAARGRSTRDIVRAEKRREERLADLGYEIVR